MNLSKIAKLASIFISAQKMHEDFASVEGRDYQIINLPDNKYIVYRIIAGKRVAGLEFAQDRILRRTGNPVYAQEIEKDMYKFPSNLFKHYG